MTAGRAIAVASESTPGGMEFRAVIEEFGRVLDIFGAQLDASVKEADRECVAVGAAFDTLAAATRRLGQIDCPQPALAAVRNNAAVIGESLDAAVIALQYQDRLAQRVGHIRVGLNQLQRMLRDGVPRSCEQSIELLRDVERAHQAEQERLVAAEIAANGSAELF